MFYRIKKGFNALLKLWLSYFNRGYKNKLAEYIAPLCEDHSSILDFGCNDGTVSDLIKKINPTLEITGIDVQSFHPAKIKKIEYDGKTIPFADKSFDIVYALDVLHHTNDIPAALQEIKRVCKKYIILKDVQTRSIFSYYLICFADFITNQPNGIPCAYNFPSPSRWNIMFKNLELRPVASVKKINLGAGLNHRYNFIIKLER